MRTHTSWTLFALIIFIAWFVAPVVSMPFETHTAHARQVLTQDALSDEALGQDSPSDKAQDPGDEHQKNEPRWLGFTDFAIIVRSLFLVGFPGILGGIVAGRFRRTENVGDVTIVGDVTNAAAGLLGAYAIFLIIPGDFTVEPGKALKFKHLVEIIGLAAVGGFGGKAILTIALNKALGAKVDKLDEQQQKQSAAIESAHKAEKAAQKVLQHDEMAVDVTQLAEIFKDAPADVLGKIFYSAREQRKDNEAPLIDANGVGLNPAVITNQAALKLHRKKIEYTESVFRALIERDTERVYQRNHAQLSYALTGRDKPDWKEAETQIGLAIAKRDKNADMVERNRIYEFHLACILIEIAKEADALNKLDQRLISKLLSKAAGEHANKITAAFDLWLNPPDGKRPNVDDPHYERYASLLHFAATHEQAAKELLEKLKAPGR